MTVSNHPTYQHGHTNFWYVCPLEFISITKITAIMYGMYIEPRTSGGNTSSNPQHSVLIPGPAFNGMEGMCNGHTF